MSEAEDAERAVEDLFNTEILGLEEPERDAPPVPTEAPPEAKPVEAKPVEAKPVKPVEVKVSPTTGLPLVVGDEESVDEDTRLMPGIHVPPEPVSEELTADEDTKIVLPPHTARYVRIEQTSTSPNSSWWSINELTITP